MKQDNIDLHIYTNHSDGEHSINELLSMIKLTNLKTIAFVDHDTASGIEEVYTSSNVKSFINDGYNVYAGIEFSCSLDSYKMHLIGYISKYNDENIVNLINQIQNLRKMRLLEKINNAKNLGVEFSNEEIKYLLSLKNAGKPQIAKIIIEKGYAEDIDSAIKKYLKYKSTTNDRIDAREVIKVVHACGGTLIIAHPYQIMNDNKLDLQSTIDVWSKLKELGADGMECYYSSYTEDEINFLLSYAKNNNLIISAGSDYHGENIKPSIKLGQIST